MGRVTDRTIAERVEGDTYLVRRVETFGSRDGKTDTPPGRPAARPADDN